LGNAVFLVCKSSARCAYRGMNDLSQPVRPKKVSTSFNEAGKRSAITAAIVPAVVDIPSESTRYSSRTTDGYPRNDFSGARLTRLERNKSKTHRR
jgi:hypothetical protein